MRLLLLIATATLLLAGCGPRTSPEPLVVGHLAALGGADRVEGERAREAVQMAVAEANNEPINGRKIQVLLVDTQGKPELAYAEAVRLVTINRAVGLISSDALSEASTGHGVPLLTAAPLPRPKSQPNLFSINAAPEFHGEILARFAAEQLKASRAVVVVEEAGPLNPVIADAVRHHWVNKTAGAVTFVPLSGEVRPDEVGTRVGAIEADVVVFAGSAETFKKLRAKLKPAGGQGAILFAGPPQEWRKFLASPEGGSAAVYTTALYPPPGSWDDNQKKFAEDYRKRFNADPTDSTFEAGEMSRLLFTALRQSKGAPAKVREELVGLKDVPGISGPLSIDHQHVRRSLHIVRFQDKTVTLMQSYAPRPEPSPQ